MSTHRFPRFAVSRDTLRTERITVISTVTGAAVAVGLSAVCLVGCAAHATTSPPARPAASRPSSPEPVASAVAAPAASPTPCPTESGWTGENLSMAAPDPAAWLTAAQMPDAAVYQWTSMGPPIAQPFAQDVPNPFQTVSVSDFLAWQFQNFQGSPIDTSQELFLYASAAEAQCQYQSAVAEAAGTQAQLRSIQAQFGIPADAVTSEIVSGEDDSVWTASWTGPNDGMFTRGPQTDVDYMAQVGTAVTFVGFDLPGLDQGIPDAAAAQATLNRITQDLSVYATGS
jgi:hypothetical protein